VRGVHDMLTGQQARVAVLHLHVSILVSHTGLHDVLKAFAFAVELVDRIVFLLQRPLQVLHHA